MVERGEASSTPGGVARPSPSPSTSLGKPDRRGLGEALRIRDVMTRKVITAIPEWTLKEAADLLVEHRISGVPVVRGTSVVGVLSEKDIMRFVLIRIGRSQLPAHLLALFREFTADQAGRTLRDVRQVLTSASVSEAMSAHPVVVAPDARLEEAAQIMIDHKIHRLPVLDRGKLVGIVTRDDLVRIAAGALVEALDHVP
jgi:CBS domain-containing protein